MSNKMSTTATIIKWTAIVGVGIAIVLGIGAEVFGFAEYLWE